MERFIEQLSDLFPEVVLAASGLGLLQGPAPRQRQPRARHSDWAVAVNEVPIELGQVRRASDPLPLEPGPVPVPVLARHGSLVLDSVHPQLDVLIEVALVAGPAVAALEVAEVKFGVTRQLECARR
jgi:hypothetical protein